ncbi:MAG: winged helix-turn-helix domain-containing protein [Paraglaciecola sp.]|uniref:nSTAND1 domain-containing NTPase n=1 Tax=Paraglaciecola sp. TaxID=1920173 RepID=UPI00326594D8
MLKKGKDLFFLQDWQVNPSTNTLQRGEQTKQLEPKAMDVLLLLCNQQGNVLSADEIATQCWGGIDIGDNPVHKAVTQLRKALGDKASAPTYIETIRKRGYHIIAELDFPLDEELKAAQSTWHDASPFPGLVPFSAKDAQVFFGRNEQIATLLERISNQVNAKHAFTLILGPSGTGKSSLVNAGLLPRLTSENGYNGIGVVSHTSIDFADISQERLLIDIASAMLDWDVNDHPVFSGMSAEGLATELQNNAAASIQQCHLALKASQQSYSKPQFLLFIDRLEVLLSSPTFSDDEREQCLNLIETLTTSGAIIVLSACRNDFYPLVVNHPSLMANKGAGGHFDLLAPTRAELMQMIRLPAVAANLTWSTDKDNATPLDQLLCDEAAHNPDALPMLQYTLQELYLQRSNENELQVEVYKALGGIEGAIGKKAEEVYQQLPPAHQPQLATVLSRLITLSPDGETITSRAARWSQLTLESETALVQAMVDSRLFVSHLQNGEPCFSLAHEALLRRWPRASEWINQHKDSLAIKSRLQQLTERWVKEGKSSAYLLPKGKPLEEAVSLQSMPVFTLDSDELALLKASQQKVTTKRWINRSIITLLCLLTFTAIFMSVKSQQAEAIAQQKRLDAESLLGFMVGEFADKLRSVKRMDLLDGISNKALEYFSTEIDESINFNGQFQHAQTLMAMGEVAYSRAKNDEAQQAFTSAKLILDNLFQQQPVKMALLKNLGANAFWLGQLKYDESDFEGAQPLFELYRDYSEKMNELEPDNEDGWLERSYAEETLGVLFMKLQEYSEAKNAFQVSLKMKKDLIKHKKQDNGLRFDIAKNLSWLVSAELHLGNLPLSQTLHEQGQRELEILLQDSQTDAYVMEILALSFYMKSVYIFEFQAKFTQALQYISKAERLLKLALEQDPQNEDWKAQLLNLDILRFRLSSSSNITSTFSDNINESFDNVNEKTLGFSTVINDVIGYFQNLKDWKSSSKFITLANKYYKEMGVSLKSNPEKIRALAEFQLLQAKQFSYSNKIEKKITSCKSAIQDLLPLIRKSLSPHYLLPFVKAHDCLGTTDTVKGEINVLQKMGITHIDFIQS